MRRAVCSHCDGTGRCSELGACVECCACSGRGYFATPIPDPGPLTMDVWDAHFRLTPQQRDELVDWFADLVASDHDNGFISASLGEGTITFELYALNDDRKRYLDPATGRAVTRWETVRAPSVPPYWKPVR